MSKLSRQLLEWNCIDILASDAHDDDVNGFYLKAGREAVSEIRGPDVADRLTVDNPKVIWENRPWNDEKSTERTAD